MTILSNDGSRPKVGLALGSGAARGWAHLGVIRALNEAEIQIHCVAGTSIGALIGAVFASGGSVELFEEVVLKLDWGRIISFFDVVYPKSGLLDGKKVENFVRQHVHSARIEDLSIPFAAVATDLGTGLETVFEKGDVIEAVRASISVPGVFTPARYDAQTYVDGGLVNPIPVDVARRMGADLVIAVDLSSGLLHRDRVRKTHPKPQHHAHGEEMQPPLLAGLKAGLENRPAVGSAVRSQIDRWRRPEPSPSIFEVLIGSISIMEAEIASTRLKVDPPDLVIRPQVGHIKFLEFNRAEEAIEEGYRATVAALEVQGKIGAIRACRPS